tara:strand:+ start:343 stop:1329 length:987 start_codon:yes stop_codon:yes gene_type:complete
MPNFEKQTNPKEDKKFSEEEGDYYEEYTVEEEKKDSDFDTRYENLENERNLIKREREITFQLSILQSEGLDTLVGEYGGDKVFNVIKEQFKTNPRGDVFSTFEVIRALEPDSKKRADLFEKIKTDSRERGEEMEQDEHDYFKVMWGSAGNFSRGTGFRVEAMKSLDSVFGKIAPQRHYNILGSRMQEFAVHVSQFEEEEKKLKEQLAEVGDDTFKLVENRNKNSEQKREELRLQADKLHKELVGQVERITNELNTEFEKWRAKVIGDLAAVGSLETESEEMKSALQVALERVESEIATQFKNTEQKISEKTESLQKLIGGVEGIRGSY